MTDNSSYILISQWFIWFDLFQAQILYVQMWMCQQIPKNSIVFLTYAANISVKQENFNLN